LRREKNETDLNLPPKKEIVVYAPLTDKQRELYTATLDKHLEVLLNKKRVCDFFYLYLLLIIIKEKYSFSFITLNY